MAQVPLYTTNETDYSATTALSARPREVDLVSKSLVHSLELVTICVVSNIFGILGVPANLVTLSVFVKQGLGDSVNISLFALSTFDLAYLIAALASNSYCFFPDVIFDDVAMDNVRQTSLPCLVLLKIAFSRISNALTALIAVERCACVLLPLTFKRMVTRRCTAMAVVAIVATIGGLFVPVLMMFEVTWLVDAANRTMAIAVPTKFLSDNQAFLSVLADSVVSVTLPIVTLIVVCLCTLLTVLRLVLSARWRQAASTPQLALSAGPKPNGCIKVPPTVLCSSSENAITSDPANINSVSLDVHCRYKSAPDVSRSALSTKRSHKPAIDQKTNKLTKMLLILACVNIICLLPNVTATVARLVIPEFNFNAR